MILERAKGFEPSTPTLARLGATTTTVCFSVSFHLVFPSLPTLCPFSLQFLHRLPTMRGADGRVPLHHAKGFPSSLLSDCLKVDARHHAPTSPMVPPIVNVKIGDARSSARGRMRFLNRTATGEFVFACICIRRAALREKYSTFLRRAARHPETMERRARAFAHCYGARLPGLSLSNEHRIVRPCQRNVIAIGRT